VTGSGLGGVLIAFLVSGFGLVNAFGRRHEPAPPNHWTKLPFALLLTGLCVWFAAEGIDSWVFAVLAVVCVYEVTLVLRGRNPWWMRSRWDRRQGPVDRA
jgi:hypothetical protein